MMASMSRWMRFCIASIDDLAIGFSFARGARVYGPGGRAASAPLRTRPIGPLARSVDCGLDRDAGTCRLLRGGRLDRGFDEREAPGRRCVRCEPDALELSIGLRDCDRHLRAAGFQSH